MMDLFFANGAGWFSVPAIIGSLVLLVRLALMMLGGDLDSGFDIETDLDVGGGSDAFGQFLSVQAVSAFLMGFGWAGLACLNGFGLGWAWCVLVGLGVGIALTAVQAWLFSIAMGLQGSGHVELDEAVGQTGEITVTVPASDDAGEGASGTGVGSRRGSVRMVIRQTQKEYAAVSTGPRLPRGTVVRVVEARGGSMVVVEPVVEPLVRPAASAPAGDGDTGASGDMPADADSEERSDG